MEGHERLARRTREPDFAFRDEAAQELRMVNNLELRLLAIPVLVLESVEAMRAMRDDFSGAAAAECLQVLLAEALEQRSEERRVGKECRL